LVGALSLLPLALEHGGLGSEDLLVYPPKQRVVELHQLLPWDVRQHGPALAFIHQIPHGRYRFDAAALVGYLGVVRYKVKFPATMTEAALLDFMGGHRRLAWNDPNARVSMASARK